ncbi:hypothetical protein D9M69_392790 [compost metagenome]
MPDQPFADATAVDHAEHPGGHAGGQRGADDGAGHVLGGGHVAAVRLDDHRAAGGQRRGGVATGGGERQREVGGAEHRHRADAQAALAQVGARQRLALGLRPVDARTEEVAAPQGLGEQTQLVAGPCPLALHARRRQRGLAGHGGEEVGVQRIQFSGDGIEELGATGRRQAAERRVRGLGGQGGGIDFFGGGLHEAAGQGFAGAGIEAVQLNGAGSAAHAGDEIVTGQGHGISCRLRGIQKAMSVGANVFAMQAARSRPLSRINPLLPRHPLPET